MKLNRAVLSESDLLVVLTAEEFHALHPPRDCRCGAKIDPVTGVDHSGRDVVVFDCSCGERHTEPLRSLARA